MIATRKMIYEAVFCFVELLRTFCLCPDFVFVLSLCHYDDDDLLLVVDESIIKIITSDD